MEKFYYDKKTDSYYALNLETALRPKYVWYDPICDSLDLVSGLIHFDYTMNPSWGFVFIGEL